MRLVPTAVPTIVLTLFASAWVCAQSQQSSSAPPASAANASVRAGTGVPVSGSAVPDPATLPFHDTHQSFTVAADPLLKADEYKSRFGKKNPYDTGIIAIDAYFRNNSARPVQVVLEDIRLTVAAQGEEQQDLPPLSSKEVASDTLHEGQNGTAPARKRLPPLPGTAANHGKEWDELESRLRTAQIPSDIVAPHTTVHGLLYFDIDSRFDLIGVCRLYVPNLKVYGSDQALLYFEVPLSAAKSK